LDFKGLEVGLERRGVGRLFI